MTAAGAAADGPRGSLRSGLELHPDPAADIGDPGIVAGEIGVRDVVNHHRDAVDAGDLVAEFDGLAEQHRRAEPLAAGRGAILVAILQGAPQGAVDRQRIGRAEDALDDRQAPGQPEIGGIGVAGGIDPATENRPRRTDDIEKTGRYEKDFAIDVRAALDMMAAKGDVMRHDADLDLVDDATLCTGLRNAANRQNQTQSPQAASPPSQSHYDLQS